MSGDPRATGKVKGKKNFDPTGRFYRKGDVGGDVEAAGGERLSKREPALKRAAGAAHGMIIG